MATTFLPFDQGAGSNVTESQWSLMARSWLPSGVIPGELNGLAVFGDSSGMQVKIPSGKAWIMGHFFMSDAQVTLPIATANGSNPRVDRVVLRVDWTGNTIAFAVLQGTAAASPAIPALTQTTAIWEIHLANVRVPAATATIAASSVNFAPDYALDATTQRENRLGNGGWEDWLRGTGPYTVSGVYGADRWRVDMSNSTYALIRINSTIGTLGGSGQLTYTHNGALGGFADIKQIVSDNEMLQLRGKTVTFSCWLKSTVLGTTGIWIDPGSGGVFSGLNVSAGAEFFTITATVPSSATQIICAIRVSNASCVVEINDAMLVEGNAPRPYWPVNQGAELIRIQRYAQKLTASIRGKATAAGDLFDTHLNFVPGMAGTPTITLSGGARTNNTGMTTPLITATGVRLEIAATAAGDTYEIERTVLAEFNP